MKKMKYVIIVVIFSFILVLASCHDNKTVVSYYLNDFGNLIAEYDNGDTTDLGEFDATIIRSIKFPINSFSYGIILNSST